MTDTTEIELQRLPQFAESFTRRLKGGDLIFLTGPLGAGKTTFTRELMRTLGSDEVTSPTFILCHEYKTDRGFLVEHWDLYRLKEAPDELHDPPPRDVVRIVEWAEKFRSDLSAPTYEVLFELTDAPTTRRVTILNENDR